MKNNAERVLNSRIKMMLNDVKHITIVLHHIFHSHSPSECDQIFIIYLKCTTIFDKL